MNRYIAELVVSNANKKCVDHFEVKKNNVEKNNDDIAIQRQYISGEVWNCFQVVFETNTETEKTLCQYGVDGPFTKTLYNALDVNDLVKYVEDAVKYITMD